MRKLDAMPNQPAPFRPLLGSLHRVAGFCLGYGVTVLLTAVLKNTVGSLRPGNTTHIGSMRGGICVVETWRSLLCWVWCWQTFWPAASPTTPASMPVRCGFLVTWTFARVPLMLSTRGAARFRQAIPRFHSIQWCLWRYARSSLGCVCCASPHAVLIGRSTPAALHPQVDTT